MVFADLARAGIVCFLGIMVLQRKATPLLLMGCTLMMSCFETLRLPAANSIVPLLISQEEYATGISFSASLSKITELVGTGIAGVIIALLGMPAAIFLDALSFMVSAILIYMMRVKEGIRINDIKSSFRNHFVFGINYALKHQDLLLLAVMASLANMVLVPFNALQSAFVSNYYHGNVSFFFFFEMAVSSDSIIGGLLYPKIRTLIKPRHSLLMRFPTTAFYYVALLASGRIDHLYWLLISIALISLITGIVVGIASCNVSVLLMLKTKQEYLSRISGLFNAVSQMFNPILSLLIGVAGRYLDVSTIFLFSAIIIMLIAIIAYNDKKMESLND